MNSHLSRIIHRCFILPKFPHLWYLQCQFCYGTSNCHSNYHICTTSKKLFSQRSLPHLGRLYCITPKHRACKHHAYQLSQPVAAKQVTYQQTFAQSASTWSMSSWAFTNHTTFARKFLVASKRLYASDKNKKDPPHHDTVLVSLQRLEDSLRYHGYSTIRIGFAIFAVLGIGIYIFRESIRENVADEVSQVATRSLEDRLVADKAEEFSKGLLNALLKDEPMHQLASQFVREVLQRSETKQAMNALVMGVLQDPNTKAQLTATVKQVIVAALNEEETQAYIKSIIKVILSDKETKLAVINLLGYVFSETEVKELTAAFFKDVLKSEMVVDQATQLGKQVTNSIISDPALQEKTGDSLWTAMKYSVTPRWFSSSSSSSSDEDGEDDAKYEKETVTSDLDADEETVLGG